MKLFITMILTFISLASFAQNDDGNRIKISEIKNYVGTINPDSTCLDEYLKRRKQLMIKLAAAPVTIVGGTLASFYGGALAGSLISVAGGYDQLTSVIGGAFLGTVGGAVGTTAASVQTVITLNNTNLILQTIASEKMERKSNRDEKLYAKYLKKSQKDLSQDEFLSKLMELDASGAICDGSLVKQPKIRLGFKLKYKVVKLKGLVKAIDSL